MRRSRPGRSRRGPLSRLLGLETEYAIRFSPASGVRPPGGRTPGNDVIFNALSAALGRLVPTRPGSSAVGRDQFFTVNGGAFYYEFLPQRMDGGLIEGATPECRGPRQLLLYQRAQEALLQAALPLAAADLAADGAGGEVGLLKNSRDAEGNVYGAQENYEAEIASGVALWLYRLGLALLLPVLALVTAVTFLVVVVLLAAAVVGFAVALLVPSWRRRLLTFSAADERRFENAFGRFHLWLVIVSTWPVITLLAIVLRCFAFRRIRRQMTAFLVSRQVIAGCGSVAGGRRFVLSEKGQAIRSVLRRTIRPEDRPIFDTGNLMKMLCAPFNLQLSPIPKLFGRTQRLQLGLADSNRAQEAEYLKVGTATLVLDMIEDGFVDDAPRLRHPLGALREVIGDLSLGARLELRDGTSSTALEIQRFYLDRAREYLRQAPATSLEAEDVVRRWAAVLEALEAGDMESLVGRLDWVTKRFLLEACGGDAGDEVLKTLDLRYHELGEGYFDRLENAGETETMVGEDEVREAMREPPADTPAFHRGRFIRRQDGRDLPIAVSWDSATIGRRWRGKVVPFRRPAPDGELSS
ncbi:MAG: proteasome accessory factor PafA2 family protein [Thermoanaerobaculia bacterium]